MPQQMLLHLHQCTGVRTGVIATQGSLSGAAMFSGRGGRPGVAQFAAAAVGAPGDGWEQMRVEDDALQAAAEVVIGRADLQDLTGLGMPTPKADQVNRSFLDHPSSSLQRGHALLPGTCYDTAGDVLSIVFFDNKGVFLLKACGRVANRRLGARQGWPEKSALYPWCLGVFTGALEPLSDRDWMLRVTDCCPVGAAAAGAGERGCGDAAARDQALHQVQGLRRAVPSASQRCA